MDCIVICCFQPGLFINITCNNENIHIDSTMHLILNQFRISRGRVKRVLLKITKIYLQKILIAFRNLPKQKKQEYCHIIYEENFDLYTYNSPSNDLIWTFSWPFRPVVNLDCSRGFRPSPCALCAPICVEYSRVTPPCHRFCQRAHSECLKLMELFGVAWPEDMECSRCENHRFFMDHCFFCSIFKIICLLVHQFLRTFQSVYITYNFEQKFHASELFISLGIWNGMKKVEKEKHFYEENF